MRLSDLKHTAKDLTMLAFIRLKAQDPRMTECRVCQTKHTTEDEVCLSDSNHTTEDWFNAFIRLKSHDRRLTECIYQTWSTRQKTIHLSDLNQSTQQETDRMRLNQTLNTRQKTDRMHLSYCQTWYIIRIRMILDTFFQPTITDIGLEPKTLHSHAGTQTMWPNPATIWSVARNQWSTMILLKIYLRVREVIVIYRLNRIA